MEIYTYIEKDLYCILRDKYGENEGEGKKEEERRRDTETARGRQKGLGSSKAPKFI
jgi:hypothetical protein